LILETIKFGLGFIIRPKAHLLKKPINGISYEESLISFWLVFSAFLLIKSTYLIGLILDKVYQEEYLLELLNSNYLFNVLGGTFYIVFTIFFYTSYIFAICQRWELEISHHKILFYTSLSFIPLLFAQLFVLSIGSFWIVKLSEEIWFAVLLFSIFHFALKRKILQSIAIAIFLPFLSWAARALFFGIEI